MSRSICSVATCSREVYARGWCNMHWQRWRSHGSVADEHGLQPVEKRFWAKVNKKGPYSKKCRSKCWVWTASTSKGYGNFTIKGKQLVAHRVAYEMCVGPIPEGLTLDHLCRNKSCVRPSHCEPVTMRVNTLRGTGPSAINAKKKRCPKGHPYNKRNTYIVPTTGERRCKACLVKRQ